MIWPFTKRDSEKQLDDRVCIPEARKEIDAKEAEKNLREEAKKIKETILKQGLKKYSLPTFNDTKPRLYLEGIFSVSNTLMLKGTVVSGKIGKTSKLKVKKKTFKVKDLQLNGRSVGSLQAGQKGAIFFDKAKGLYLKQGEVVKFA